jgi:hypothetical protein
LNELVYWHDLHHEVLGDVIDRLKVIVDIHLTIAYTRKTQPVAAGLPPKDTRLEVPCGFGTL